MILQALHGYYSRLADDPEKEVPVPGFSRQKAHFALVVDKNGILTSSPKDIRLQKGKKLLPKTITAPAVQRTAGIAPNFAWDNTGYVLGADNKGNPERAKKMFESFRIFHHRLCDNTEDEGLTAVLRFLDSWNPEDAPTLENWDELTGQNVVFQLEGELRYVHERPAAKKIWKKYQMEKASEVSGRCLVNGDQTAIARLHPLIKGVRGAQTSGAAIVSFNKDAFTSYGKKQSYNSPVGEEAVFTYSTALNYLLRTDSRQKIQVGDATTVFWTERDSKIEGMFGVLLDPSESDSKQLRDFLDAVRQGKISNFSEDPEMRFYILGLSPNASRLSVRFWHVSTVKNICAKIGQHFQDLSIAKEYEDNPDFPGMWRLLRETAPLRKLDNVSPLLAGSFMRSILTGAMYPQTLLSAAITRIRADGQINYMRAAIIKAFLVRKYRINKKMDMEVKMGLDKTSSNVAYLLGRLFAVLEKVQKDALPGAKATIKDRYYASASATPRAVFPQLLRLAQHHIQKSDYGHVSDKRIEEIIERIDSFPSHLNIEDQGLFALGYYHQRPGLYRKSENKKET